MADDHHHHHRHHQPYLNIPNADARCFLTSNPISAVMAPENRPCSTLLPSAATFQYLPHPGVFPRGLSSNLSLPFDHHRYPFDISNNYNGVVVGRHVTDINLRHAAPGGNNNTGNGAGGSVDELDGHDYATAAVSMENAAEMETEPCSGYVNFGRIDGDSGGGVSIGAGGGGNGDGPGSLEYYSGGNIIGSSRWPRQEALCLLEIRTKLDPKFKEANHKGLLWNEVARLMEVEFGYTRSPKKCREKLDNLYKYYKKTKEGKAGRHDGKHYRFFRQLDALFGASDVAASINAGADPPSAVGNDSNNIHASSGNINLDGFHHDHNTNATSSGQFQQQAIGLSTGCSPAGSLSNSYVYATTPTDDQDHRQDDHDQAAEGSGVSTEDQHGPRKKKKKKKKATREDRINGWKSRITEFIGTRMKGLIHEQEERLDKMMRMLESREQERMQREEEWRKQETERAVRLQQLWASERAMIKARDVALIEALEKLVGSVVMMKERSTSSPSSEEDQRDGLMRDRDHHRDAGGDTVVAYRKNEELQRPVPVTEASRSGHDQNANASTDMGDGCFRFLFGEGENLWGEDYGVKMNRCRGLI